MVDRNGNIVNNYSYDEWGNITTSSETVSNPFKYAGEVYDSETGLYYLKARYYDPSIGRFINEDTVEGQVDNPLSLNLYSYCYNNPIIYKDSTGNKPYSIKVDSLYTIGGYGHYYDYTYTERGSDAITTALNFIPYMGTIMTGCYLLTGWKEIDGSSAKGLMGILDRIKANDMTSLSLDILSTLEYLEDAGKLSKVLRISGKLIGKTAGYTRLTYKEEKI